MAKYAMIKESYLKKWHSWREEIGIIYTYKRILDNGRVILKPINKNSEWVRCEIKIEHVIFLN